MYIYTHIKYIRGSYGKESACNAGDLGPTPGIKKILWSRKWQPTPVFLPGESHGQRSLVGYSPWGHKKSDGTERLRLPLPGCIDVCVCTHVACKERPRLHASWHLVNDEPTVQFRSSESFLCPLEPPAHITGSVNSSV